MTGDPFRPLHILHVFRAPVGGLFRHVYDVAKAQAAMGHRVGILCDSTTGGERGNRLLNELSPLLELGIHRLPMRRNPHPGDLPALRLVAKVSREQQVDVIHTHGAKGGLYGRIAGVLTPRSGPVRCYTPHGGSLNYHPGSFFHRLYMRVERLLEFGTDLFLFESRFIADRYAEFVHPPARPARVALNGLYPHEFEPVVPHPDATDFLYVGEFREAKGIDTLVEALFRLANAGIHPSITLVGSGPSEQGIREMVEARGIAGQFRWRPVTPAAEAFRLGRIMVVPSRFESLPYIVLEAVAGHLPLITTDVGGIPEIVSRTYPYLLPANDPIALSAAMADAVARPFAELQADAGRLSDEMSQVFRVDRMVETILDGYAAARAERRQQG